MAEPQYSDHLLPDNSTPLQRALSASDHRLLSVPHSVVRAAWDPDTCPEHLLPYLAQAWSVDEWDPDWPIETRREVIKQSPAIHRVKGTKGALVRAMNALGIGLVVREWFEYSGQPYAFRLEMTLGGAATWSAAQARQIYRVALAAKNVRSWLETIIVRHDPPSDTPIGFGLMLRSAVVIGNYIGPLERIDGPRSNVYAGVAVSQRLTITNIII